MGTAAEYKYCLEIQYEQAQIEGTMDTYHAKAQMGCTNARRFQSLLGNVGVGSALLFDARGYEA